MKYFKNTETTKYCPKCKQFKPRTDFHRVRARPDGCASYCKLCSNILNREYRKRYLSQYRDRQKTFSYRFSRTPSGRYTTIKSRAKRAGVPLSMGRQEYVDWFNEQSLECHYCGRTLEAPVDNAKRQIDSLVIDRKDPNVGYALSNICLSCWLCNVIKSYIFTEEEMIYIGRNFLRNKIIKNNRIGGKHAWI